MSSELDDKPYEVGYGKPPKEHQFKPGQSGWPGGRPKGASVRGPALRELARNPDEDGYGEKAVEAARRLIDIARGVIKPDPSEVKALVELADWADGKLVQERINTNIELSEGVEMRDRRVRPAPGTETKPNGADGQPS